MYIVVLKKLFSAISSINIFVICRSAKEYAHGEVHEENADQTFSVFAPEQCLEMGNYKYSFDRNFITFWQMELMCFLLLLFFVATSCLFYVLVV